MLAGSTKGIRAEYDGASGWLEIRRRQTGPENNPRKKVQIAQADIRKSQGSCYDQPKWTHNNKSRQGQNNENTVLFGLSVYRSAAI